MSILFITLQLLVSFAFASTGFNVEDFQKMVAPKADCARLLSGFDQLSDALPSNAGEKWGCVSNSIPINTRTLWVGYLNAIFPWGTVGRYGVWCTPPQRGILDFNDLRINRSDLKEVRRLNRQLQITEDKDFAGVIKGCADTVRLTEKRGVKVAADTWISPEVQRGYIDFAKAGFAHSIEVWDGDLLVGGLYYSEVQGVVTGESIFSLPGYPGAGKAALYRLVQIELAKGHTFIDIQEFRDSGLLKKWGAKAISREDYVKEYLRPAQDRNKSMPEALPI